MHGGVGLLEQCAVIAGYAADHVRIDANAIARKNGECRGVLEQVEVSGAQRNGQVGRQRASDAEAARHINDAVHADFFGELHGGYVAGAFESAAQRNHAFVFFVVIVRRIGLATAHHRKRRVEDSVERCEALFKSSRINVHLERAANLALGLHGAIEFRILETVTADHGLDFTRAIVDRNHGGLRTRVLLEFELDGAAGNVTDQELRHVAWVKQFACCLVSRPGEIGFRKDRAVRPNLDQCGLSVHREHQSVDVVALFNRAVPVFVVIILKRAVVIA